MLPFTPLYSCCLPYHFPMDPLHSLPYMPSSNCSLFTPLSICCSPYYPPVNAFLPHHFPPLPFILCLLPDKPFTSYGFPNNLPAAIFHTDLQHQTSSSSSDYGSANLPDPALQTSHWKTIAPSGPAGRLSQLLFHHSRPSSSRLRGRTSSSPHVHVVVCVCWTTPRRLIANIRLLKQ